MSGYETPRLAAHVSQPLEENHTHCTHIPGTHILTNMCSPKGVVGVGGCERGGSGLPYMVSITNDYLVRLDVSTVDPVMCSFMSSVVWGAVYIREEVSWSSARWASRVARRFTTTVSPSSSESPSDDEEDPSSCGTCGGEEVCLSCGGEEVCLSCGGEAASPSEGGLLVACPSSTSTTSMLTWEASGELQPSSGDTLLVGRAPVGRIPSSGL